MWHHCISGEDLIFFNIKISSQIFCFSFRGGVLYEHVLIWTFFGGGSRLYYKILRCVRKGGVVRVIFADCSKKRFFIRWATGLATNGLGTRRTLSRPRKRPTCTQPKQPQPPSHLVAVLHGEDLRSREVEEAVEGKEVPASKAFKKKI